MGHILEKIHILKGHFLCVCIKHWILKVLQSSFSYFFFYLSPYLTSVLILFYQFRRLPVDWQLRW